MKFDLSPAQNFLQCDKDIECNPKIHLEDMLPPDDTWDVLSKSHHNNFPTVTSAANFQSVHITATTRTTLPHLREVAVAHGKPFALTEWGTEQEAVSNCGTTVPSQASSTWFYEGTYAFLASVDPDEIAWDTVFQVGCSRMDNRNPTTYPSTARFNELWNGQ
jgi:hypothetical protein